jgi:glycosyltransferase involved in cell wall biosynthesis
VKISLITVSFNSAATIRDTFESVLAQSYNDYEYIVIDGLYKDATVDIIKEYEPRFSGKMRWISEKDFGLYDAMNKGIKMATGDVVGILNSDDFFTDSAVLENVNQAFEQNQTDAVYGDVCYVKADNTDILDRYYSSKKFKRWKMRIGLIPAHPTFYAKIELFDKLGV